MLYIELILIAVSLSMDAFSLAISMSALKEINYSKYVIYVGLFHFFMPLIGNVLRYICETIYKFPSKQLFVGVIIFIIIGIIIDKKDNKIANKILKPLVFAFTVSIDSFTLGLSLDNNIIFISCVLFMIFSSIFTFIGFKIGNFINNNFHKYTKIFSISILVIVLIIKLIKL